MPITAAASMRTKDAEQGDSPHRTRGPGSVQTCRRGRGRSRADRPTRRCFRTAQAAHVPGVVNRDVGNQHHEVDAARARHRPVRCAASPTVRRTDACKQLLTNGHRPVKRNVPIFADGVSSGGTAHVRCVQVGKVLAAGLLGHVARRTRCCRCRCTRTIHAAHRPRRCVRLLRRSRGRLRCRRVRRGRRQRLMPVDRVAGAGPRRAYGVADRCPRRCHGWCRGWRRRRRAGLRSWFSALVVARRRSGR